VDLARGEWRSFKVAATLSTGMPLWELGDRDPVEQEGEVNQMVEYTDVACKRCGSERGERCVNAKGHEVPPSLSHKARRDLAIELSNRRETEGAKGDAYFAGRETDLTRKVPEGWQPDSTGALVNGINPTLEKERRIKQVLWSINFARKVMGVSQDQLDLNLAEMIVDGGVDVSC